MPSPSDSQTPTDPTSGTTFAEPAHSCIPSNKASQDPESRGSAKTNCTLLKAQTNPQSRSRGPQTPNAPKRPTSQSQPFQKPTEECPTPASDTCPESPTSADPPTPTSHATHPASLHPETNLKIPFANCPPPPTKSAKYTPTVTQPTPKSPCLLQTAQQATQNILLGFGQHRADSRQHSNRPLMKSGEPSWVK